MPESRRSGSEAETKAWFSLKRRKKGWGKSNANVLER